MDEAISIVALTRGICLAAPIPSIEAGTPRAFCEPTPGLSHAGTRRLLALAHSHAGFQCTTVDARSVSAFERSSNQPRRPRRRRRRLESLRRRHQPHRDLQHQECQRWHKPPKTDKRSDVPMPSSSRRRYRFQLAARQSRSQALLVGLECFGAYIRLGRLGTLQKRCVRVCIDANPAIAACKRSRASVGSARDG